MENIEQIEPTEPEDEVINGEDEPAVDDGDETQEPVA